MGGVIRRRPRQSALWVLVGSSPPERFRWEYKAFSSGLWSLWCASCAISLISVLSDLAKFRKKFEEV